MNVGDYVRTNNGLIFKIIGGNEDNWDLDIEYSKLEYMEDTWLELYRYNDNAGWFIHEHCKSSPNIIDLIEVGDYVNGEQVSRIKQCPEYHLGDGILIFNEHNETIYSNFRTSKYYDIKSIVTKEQFESMEYKVGD